LAVVGILVVGALAYLYFAGGSGEPSTELTTPTLASPDASGGTAPEGFVAFVIDPGQSLATFELDEVLRGSPQHVVGTTTEVAGQVQFDPEDLTTVQFSQILVNARTFATDSSLRDRAIRGPIVLNSAEDEFEFITFDVTSVDGLPDSISPGEEVTFTMTGDLHIKETIAPVTFDVTVEMTEESTITGTAQTTVLRSDFGIGIPNAPGVADVTDEVLIKLDFVAVAS
jgi:polyisoprenoid-binding protein YceI